MAIGLQSCQAEKPINLTELRKNSRARKDKSTRTKTVRKSDVDETLPLGWLVVLGLTAL